LALSSDGRAALIGGPRDDTTGYFGGYVEGGGAAWTFTRSGSTWTQQGEKLVGEVGLGAATALSGDGNTAVIGSSTPEEHDASGAAVFTRSGSSWAQPSLLWKGNVFERGFPRVRVALSSDASTALIDGPGNAESVESVPPVARLFIRSGSTWTQQVPALGGPPCGQADPRICGVALSRDTSTALVGTAVYVDPVTRR
jgi:hypothetical protein